MRQTLKFGFMLVMLLGCLLATGCGLFNVNNEAPDSFRILKADYDKLVANNFRLQSEFDAVKGELWELQKSYQALEEANADLQGVAGDLRAAELYLRYGLIWYDFEMGNLNEDEFLSALEKIVIYLDNENTEAAWAELLQRSEDEELALYKPRLDAAFYGEISQYLGGK